MESNQIDTQPQLQVECSVKTKISKISLLKHSNELGKPINLPTTPSDYLGYYNYLYETCLKNMYWKKVIGERGCEIQTPWEEGAKALSFFLLPSTLFFLPPPHLLPSLEVYLSASFEALLCFIGSVIHLFRSLIPQ